MATDPTRLFAYEMERIFAEGAARAIAEGGAQVMSRVAVFAKKFSDNVGNKADLARVHADVGKAMQRAVLNSYAQTVTARKAASGNDYRSNASGSHRRYAGGALKRALQNPRMVQADSHGIGFIDRGVLDQEAKHWARLNFGAGDPGKGARNVRLRLFGQAVGTIGFGEDVRPPVVVPPGFWYRPGQGWVKPSAGGHRDQFYVAGANSPGRWKTARIRGRHFLEAGLDAMARELPIQYETLLQKWLSQSLR